MKFDSFVPGMTVYDVGRRKLGNTTMSTVAVWAVRIIATDTVMQTVTASWNSNPARIYYAHDYAKWRKSEPVLVKSGWGHRLATRKELKAMKEPQA